MPVMTGIKLLRALREKLIKLTFIFASSEGSPKHVMDGKAIGSSYHFIKPFMLEKLQRAFSSLGFKR